jgi:prepilin-type N-terminal cleavage/methylation domain-containing protein
MRVAPAHRRGYTLLEILIATAIGVVLLGALYVALDVQLGLTRSGREAVNTSAVARSLLERISSDVSLSLGPIPVQTSSSNSSAGGSQTGAGATGATGATTNATNTAGGASSSFTTSSASGSTATTSSTPPFNLGVQGDDTHLTLYLSRWPRELVLPPSDPNYNNQNGNLPIVSDLRRITWWLADGGGLARQEIRIATSDEALNSPAPDLNDGFSSLVAPEVTSITFQYFDGSQWQTSWDGTQAGPDGVTPIGPPIAISVDMTLVLPSSESGGVRQTKSYHHVISLDTANGATQQSPGSNSSSTGGTSP